MNKNKISRVGSIINGTVTFLILVILIFNAGKSPIEIITNYFSFLLIALALSVIVAWRSYADIKRLFVGKRSWLRPASEGFFFGFFPIPAFHIFGMVQEAYAAGPPWPSIGYASAEVWIQYFFWLISTSSLFGAACAGYAILLSGINRLILKKLTDNESLQ
ncbi:MAG: hypothetical protein V6Z89_03245 [Desulfobacter sp.]